MTNRADPDRLASSEVTRAKNRKTFKRHLRSQCPDFKVISQKCSSYGPLPKLLKKFCSAEQNGRRS